MYHSNSNYDPLMPEKAPWGNGPVISLNGSWSSKPSSVSEKDKARLREIYKDEEVYNRVIEEMIWNIKGRILCNKVEIFNLE